MVYISMMPENDTASVNPQPAEGLALELQLNNDYLSFEAPCSLLQGASIGPIWNLRRKKGLRLLIVICEVRILVELFSEMAYII